MLKINMRHYGNVRVILGNLSLTKMAASTLE